MQSNKIFNRKQFERDWAIFFSFFPSLLLREFPASKTFLPARKFYAEAYERRKVLRKTQASAHIFFLNCRELSLEFNKVTFFINITI